MLPVVLGLGFALVGGLGATIVFGPKGDTRDDADSPVTSATGVSLDPSAPGQSPGAGPQSPGVQPTTSTGAPDKITLAEDAVTALINVERKKAGCAEVHTDERLRAAARAHSADMAKNNYFNHDSRDGRSFVDRVEAAGYPRSAAASENIAYGYGTAQAVVAAWMKSDGHRRNILNCDERATGVGLAYRGNTPYWTQDFGRT